MSLQRSIITLAAVLAIGCNVTAAPPPARTFAPTTKPPITLPPPPSDLPAEIKLPRQPVANTVYDLGKCAGNVPVIPPGGFLLVVFAFDLQSKPIRLVDLRSDSFAAVRTDDKGRAEVVAPVSTKDVTLTAADRTLSSPVAGKLGECRVLVAYFG